MNKAFACVRGEGMRGVVRFCTCENGVRITAEIFGLPDGFHGFHIHQGSDCGGDQFSNTGGHFGSGNHPSHQGDLPPLLSGNGRAYLFVETDRFRLSEVIGRTVVIHSGPDDFHTQPAGNSGEKIACGRIISC